MEARARQLFPAHARVLEPGAVTAGSARFDAAYAGPGALAGVDLREWGRTMADALPSGAPVLLCLERAGAGLRPSRARLGPEFIWRGGFALGVIVPHASRQAWVRGHPQAFGVLAALERVARRSPLVRGLGDYAAIEGVRR
jgi:hypothetical protein